MIGRKGSERLRGISRNTARRDHRRRGHINQSRRRNWCGIDKRPIRPAHPLIQSATGGLRPPPWKSSDAWRRRRRARRRPRAEAPPTP